MAHHFGDNVHTKSFTPREYQVELLDAAKERNIIVCLGTESGKSFIAMKLIQEMANGTRRAFGRRRDGGRGGKRTVFLVEKKKKAGKIALGLKNLTDLTVSNIWHNESTSAEWSYERWLQEIRSHQVLVMSSEACYKVLNRGILSLKYVNLLIMDNCHRAIQGHPYAKIISEFYRNLPKKRRPRILGLTAPLLLLLGCPVPEEKDHKTPPHPGFLEARLEQLEKTLDCTAETASDIVSLLRYCPRPRELVVEWSLADQRSDPVGIALSRSIETELAAAWTFIQDHRYDPMEIYQDAEFAEELSGIPDPKNDPVAVLKDFMHILRTLGPWCADRAALLLLIHLDKLKVKTPYERHFLLLCMMTTIMVKIRAICDLTFQEYKECERIYKFSTPKVLRFLEILKEFLPAVSSAKTDEQPNIQNRDDNKHVKEMDGCCKTDGIIKDQNSYISCNGELKEDEDPVVSERGNLDSVSNVSGEMNCIEGNKKVDPEMACEEYLSKKEDVEKSDNSNVLQNGIENHSCSNDEEGFKESCITTEADSIKISDRKENQNFSEKAVLETSRETPPNIRDSPMMISKESSVWDRGGRGRRWGNSRGRGRGGRGFGRGQSHSTWNRSGPDLPVSDTLCGIVFVDGRFTAKILYHLLNDLRRSDPQFSSLAAQYTVGCSMPVAGDSSSSIDPREAEAEYRKQEEVLKRFRTHECNLLIGPTGWALEDGGLELPRCNLVLRFDHESISTDIKSMLEQSKPVRISAIDYIESTDEKPDSISEDIEEQKERSSEVDLNGEMEPCKDGEALKLTQADQIISDSSELKETSLPSEVVSHVEVMETQTQEKEDLVDSEDNLLLSVNSSQDIINENSANGDTEINQCDGITKESSDATVDTTLCDNEKEIIEAVSDNDSNEHKAMERLKDIHDIQEYALKLEEEVIGRIPVSYHSYARSRARARAPDAHHVIMASEGEEANRIVDSLAHFMQIEEMLLRRCKNREPPEEEEVEADGVALQGETYCPASLTKDNSSHKASKSIDQVKGYQCESNINAKDETKEEKACVTLATAISLVNRYCAKLPSDTFTRLTPLWSLKEIKGVDRSYVCSLRLPINSPVKQDISGKPMPSRALARRSAALEACKILHQAKELDDDLMPVGKESFRAEVESEVEEEEEEEEDEEEEDNDDFEESVDETEKGKVSSKENVSTNGEAENTEKEISPVNGESDDSSTKSTESASEENLHISAENEKESSTKDTVEISIEDSRTEEKVIDFNEVHKDNKDKKVPILKDNKEIKGSLGENDNRVENQMNGIVDEEILSTNSVNENSDSYDKFELNSIQNGDKINEDLIEHVNDKDIASLDNVNHTGENDVMNSKTSKYCLNGERKGVDVNACNEKNKINKMRNEAALERVTNKGIIMDLKESVLSEAKFKEIKESKQKNRKNREEEELEEEVEEEVIIGDGNINLALDRPRPGTTKRRQYYYKRTADALTDCRPLPMYPAYLYNIGMKLVCPLPDDQNTRGRRIHPPEDSPRGFGILTLKEIPKICPFPIFTRSGEVRVCLEACGIAGPGKNMVMYNSINGEKLENKFMGVPNGLNGFTLPDPQQILLTEEQLSKALAFLNYTFAGVLRLQRYLMAFDPLASENSYLIVPTMIRKQGVKGDTDEVNEKTLNEEIIEVDWEFVDQIYGCKGESKPVPVSEEERKSFEFEASLYHDAVVMPWYRNQDQPQYFYVAEICAHLSPKSAFPGSEYKTFEEYYFKKYAIQICNLEQPLLDVDHTSARLNFLTPRYVNRKGVALPTSSEETKRAKRESLEQKQILVPELCSRHPFPASLWRKAVCLPCILYRLNALLLADQLRARVAREIGLGLEKVPKDFEWPPLDFGWSLADVLKKSKETDNQNSELKKSGRSDNKGDSNKEDKSSDEEESDEVEGEDRTKSSKKKRAKRKKKKKNNQDGVSGEERSDDDDDDEEEDSEKNDGEDWMEIGTWSNEMAVDSSSGSVPPLPHNVTMVEEGGKEGWGRTILGNNGAHVPGERVRYGSPSIWKGTSGPVEVFRGLENDLEGLETTDSSGVDDEDDLPDDEEGVEEAVLIPEEEVEDRGHHPRGKLRIQFKSDFLAEAVEVLDDSADEGSVLKAITEAGEEEDEGETGEEDEEESNWFCEEEDELDLNQLDYYVDHFENAVLNNKKMIEGNGMLLHCGKGFSLNARIDKTSVKNETILQANSDFPKIVSTDLVDTEEDKSESLMTCTNTEDGEFVTLDSLSDDDEEMFLDIPCDRIEADECVQEEIGDLSPMEEAENCCRIDSPCSSHSSVCSCSSSCSSCSSPAFSSDDDLEEEDSHDNPRKYFETDQIRESPEMNRSFSFDAQPALEGHPGPAPPLLLQALTMSNANDGINLERLETIGDSFLKYAITAYLYCTHHSIHEGKLSHLRSKQVSNVNLYRLGRRKRLGESMIAAKFEPHDNWLPPCYHVPLHLERALIRAGLPPSHWNGAEMPSLASLSPAQIGRVVREKGRRMMMKSIAEQESLLKLSGGIKNADGSIRRSVGFEGNLSHPLERGARFGNQRGIHAGRYDMNLQAGGRCLDHGSRKKGCDHAHNCCGNSGGEGVQSKDSLSSTSGNASGNNPVEELPCFVPYNLVTQQSIPDKSVADCVEALIGAYLIACGPRGALLFMAWLGIRVLPSQKTIISSPKDSILIDKGERPVGCMLPKELAAQKGELYQVSYGTLLAPPPPLALSSYSLNCDREDKSLKDISRDDCEIVCKHCLKRKTSDFPLKNKCKLLMKDVAARKVDIFERTHNNETKIEGVEFELRPAVKRELKMLLGGLNEFEKHIGYYFRDRSLLLQALTHASYSPNRLTDCYQRLEFLGDAVLDYLITRHLYEDPRQHSPGALTDLRSALVNNTIFASLAVRHGFHRFFLHLSPGLHSVVERFVRMQASNGHAICEEYYLIEEEECEEAEDVEVPKALGDVFESVAGAIFLDSGMSLDAVWKVYYQMMKAEIEQFSTNVPKSPIRELLEMEPETAKFGKPEKLADGRRVRVTVEVFGKGTFKGIGRNYRIAKCTAAKCALRQLKKRGLLFPRKN